MPTTISKPIAAHHCRPNLDYQKDNQAKIAQIVYFVSTILAREPSFAIEEGSKLQTYSKQALGIEKEQLLEMLENSKTEYKNISNMFSLTQANCQDIRTLLTNMQTLLY